MPTNSTQHPAEHNVYTQSTVAVPTEELQRWVRERGGLVPEQPGSDLSVSQPDTTPMVHSGLQEFFLQPSTVLQAPGIDQHGFVPRLRLVFELPSWVSPLPLIPPGAGDDLPFCSVVGAVHSRAEIYSALRVYGINLTVVFMPWGGNVYIRNGSSGTLVLASVPAGLNIVEIGPGQGAEIYPGTWELQGGHSPPVRFRLWPQRYSLFLKTLSTKRTAGAIYPDLSPNPNNHAITRPVTFEGAVVLAQTGLGTKSTLTIVDEATSMIEYSLTRNDTRMIKTGLYVDVYKAVLEPGDGALRAQVVIVKMHKFGSSTQLAIRYWNREYAIHRSLQHVCSG